jgi:hypothetical protein
MSDEAGGATQAPHDPSEACRRWAIAPASREGWCRSNLIGRPGCPSRKPARSTATASRSSESCYQDTSPPRSLVPDALLRWGIRRFGPSGSMCVRLMPKLTWLRTVIIPPPLRPHAPHEVAGLISVTPVGAKRGRYERSIPQLNDSSLLTVAFTV